MNAKKRLIKKAITLVLMLACTVLMFVVGLSMGLNAAKKTEFNLGISFQPMYLCDIKSWVDLDDDNIIDAGEKVFDLFNNAGNLELSNDVYIENNVLFLRPTIATGANLKLQVTNLTPARADSTNSAINISACVSAQILSTQTAVELQGTIIQHNVAPNAAAILDLSPKLDFNPQINTTDVVFLLEISETVNVSTTLTDVSFNTAFKSGQDFVTTLIPAAGKTLPTSLKIEITPPKTASQPNPEAITLIADANYTYNATTGALSILAASLAPLYANGADLSQPTLIGTLSISSSVIKYSLYINVTNISSYFSDSEKWLDITYKGATTRVSFAGVATGYNAIIPGFENVLEKNEQISVIGRTVTNCFLDGSVADVTLTNCDNLERFDNGGFYSGFGYSGIVKTQNVVVNVNWWKSYCCFVAGTQVLTDLQGNTKAVEDFKPGDSVVYYNYNTKQNVVGLVKRAVVGPLTTSFVRYKLANDCTVEASAYHPIYTQNGWRSFTGYNGYPVPQLGDIVKTINGWSKLVQIEPYTLSEILTYTLDVTDLEGNDGFDNFYAGGFLVENACVT